MPIHGARPKAAPPKAAPPKASPTPRPEVPQHVEPGEGRDSARSSGAGSEPAAFSSRSSSSRADADQFLRPQMPVSLNDAVLNADRSGVVVNVAAGPKHTLSAAEVLSAPDARRGELVRRYTSFLSLHAGGHLGRTFAAAPPVGTLSRSSGASSAQAQIGPKAIELVVEGPAAKALFGATPAAITVPTDRKLKRAESDALVPVALLALEQLLFVSQRSGGTAQVDPQAAALFLFLLGPDGLLTRGSNRPLHGEERFQNPKLLCWDFNGTVEKFGDGRTRGDLARTSRALERRGATSLITTTIAPEKPEDFMVENRIAFGGYYGKDEVRPTKGNKQYTGIALAHGISPDEAPHRMAVLGDSRTDIPSDLPGVVFFHNDALTPAPAVELLLKALDDAGGGSLARGLDEVLGGLPALPVKDPVTGEEVAEKKRARVGDVTFAVEMRNSATEKDPVWIPTVFEVQLLLDEKALAAGLQGPPPSTDVDARARFHLLVEHLADGYDEGGIPAVLYAVDGEKGEKAALAAVDRRVAHRASEVDQGRQAVTHLEEVLGSPVSFSALAGHVDALVALGDHEVASALPGILAKTMAIADVAEPGLVRGLDDHAALVRAVAEALLPTSLPFFPSAPKEGRALLMALERVVKRPVPHDEEDRQTVRAVLAEVAKTPVPGSRELLVALLAGLDEAHHKATTAVQEAFAERRARLPELLDAVITAPDVARSREQAWANIEGALASVRG